MAMNREELKKLLDETGVSAEAKAKVMKGFDERNSSSSSSTARGHGAPAPDTTEVNVL